MFFFWDGDPSSLGSLCHCLTTPSMKRFPHISHLNLCHCSDGWVRMQTFLVQTNPHKFAHQRNVFGFGSGWSLFLLSFLASLPCSVFILKSHWKSFANTVPCREKSHQAPDSIRARVAEFMQTSHKIKIYWVSTSITFFWKLPICFGRCYKQKGKIHQMN